jgi:hypothetical protein
MTEFRKLKIQPKYIGRKNDLRSLPQLLLKGKWFEEAGFEPGCYCSLKIEKGRITILNL